MNFYYVINLFIQRIDELNLAIEQAVGATKTQLVGDLDKEIMHI